ncbi:Caspase domain-containing protein [Bradyrhizobium yuanmingense]|uniref:Caspase domain-containing protein n=1 Tax=Bradyrhizobium yuanmingense TaxID=108015 RepID=A0A1C3XI52_9BRAD|nr:caspase family protein [Bradyrhizobium yuanmingense]TWI18231.1 caspase domain-containing protein [Bradyrhizobium yuanmingense]SCB51879.1 Caspase domain-containing protein [Bradyrhizobium yuanmingense]
MKLSYLVILVFVVAQASLVAINRASAQTSMVKQGTPQAGCTKEISDQAKDADTKIAREIKVSIRKPESLVQFGLFQVEIELPPQIVAKTDGVGVIVGLSENASIEDADEDIVQTRSGAAVGYTFATNTFKDMQRASVQFTTFHSDQVQTPWGNNKVKFSVRVWSGTSVGISWVITGGATSRRSIVECFAQELTPPVHDSIPIVPDPVEQSLANKLCLEEKEILQKLADKVSVTFSVPNVLQVGQAVAVSWRRAERFPISRPTFIVFSLPDESRFEGQEFIALPPSTRGPAAISFKSERVRAFVPLHAIGSEPQGQFKIKPTKAGPFAGEYAVVTKTGCGELVLSRQELPTVFVNGGDPEVVIQNIFEIESPKRSIRSNDGKYRLDVFPESFRVYDLTTGAKVVEGVGQSPNFSPGSRFVAALAGNVDEDTGGKMTLYDLRAERPVGFKLVGPILAWALNDGFLIEGTYPRGELKIRQSLIDPTSGGETSKGNDESEDEDASSDGDVGLVVPSASVIVRDSSSWESLSFRLDIERGLAVLVDSAKRTTVWELASGFSIPVSANQAAILTGFGLDSLRPPSFWETGEQLKLSHYSPKLDDIAAYLSGKRSFPKQKAFLVTHSETRAFAQYKAPQPSSDWRAKPMFVGTQELARAKAGFVDQVSSFGLDLERSSQPKPLVVATKWLKNSAFVVDHEPVFDRGATASELEKRLFSGAPIARNYLNTLKDNLPCTQLDDDLVAWRFKEHLHGLWTWSDGGKTFWLAQMLCFWKGALSTKVYLFARKGPEPAVVVDLFYPLTRSLDDVTNEALTRVRPYIAPGWLLVASAGGASVAIVDLTRLTDVAYLQDVREASALKEVYLSKDRKSVVQLNSDGNFFVYDKQSASVWNSDSINQQRESSSPWVKIPSAKLAVSGRWLDDEILLYTDQGYYWGSYEAAQFVHLRQPGQSGLHSVAQFASQLSRPDIVRAALAGTAPPRAPILNAPPQLKFQAKAIGENSLEISWEARSSASLQFVRFFADGKPLTEIEVQGTTVVKTSTIDMPPRVHRIIGIAVDQMGLVSTPFEVSLEKLGKPTGRLMGLVVGVDKYREPHLNLNYASRDAQRLKRAFERDLKVEYADVKIVDLLNDNADGEAIIRELSRVSSAASKDDTVLFFFSGHGFKDEQGHYRLTPKDFLSTASTKTGLEWSRVGAILRASKARVIVILDACHAGQSGSEEAANDQVRDALTEVEGPMIILAAAKGRQFAYEDLPNQAAKFGGGAFTYALTNLLGPGRIAADKNRNGSLELSEIYFALKSTVVKETTGQWRGVQTPWLAQRNVFGDFVLF